MILIYFFFVHTRLFLCPKMHYKFRTPNADAVWMYRGKLEEDSLRGVCKIAY